MADKLTKRQRIYAREVLFEKQGGRCRFCKANLYLSPRDCPPGESWRRGCLYRRDVALSLTCQLCCEDTNEDQWSAERAAVDEILNRSQANG